MVVGVATGVAVGVAVGVTIGVVVGVAVGVSVGSGITLTLAPLNTTPPIGWSLPSSTAAPGPKKPMIVAPPTVPARNVIWPTMNGAPEQSP